MSKIKFEGNASGTGTLTIAAPNTNTDRTLTLPDGAGEFLTSGTNSNFPAGSVLQVVSTATQTTTTISSSGTWTAATDLNVSITPISTSSKIFVIANIDYDANAANRSMQFTLYRGSTNLGNSVNGMSYHISDAGRLQGEASCSYLDSPNTTSSVTYSVYTKCSSANTYVNLYGSQSTITVMEIAG